MPQTSPATTALFTGTFDPVTYGHLDIIQRTTQLFKRVVVAVYHHRPSSPDPLTKSSLLLASERAELVKQSCAALPGVEVVIYHQLTIKLAESFSPCVLIRGVRSWQDFEYESELFYTQTVLNPHIDTLFLRSRAEHQHISSSMVRHLALHNTFTSMVPTCVNNKLKSKLSGQPTPA